MNGLLYSISLNFRHTFFTMIMHEVVANSSSETKLMVIAGPSGTGKSTLLKRLFAEHSNLFGFSVSHTTRAPRPGEKHAIDYHFTDPENMKREIAEGKFIENAVYSGNLYGTSVEAVISVLNQGKVCILDIDMQGVKSIKNTASLASRSLYLFIMPPSLAVLEERLRSRNSESTESLKQRMDIAREEMAYASLPGSYHRIIINDNLESAYAEFREFALQCSQTQKSFPS
jgi:guanylate kinase